MAIETVPGFADIDAARTRIASLARITPVFSSETLGRLSGRRVFLKAENLQRTGSFKIRGAINKIQTLGEAERAAGVVTASSGNHGQAVALAAREAGVHATVFMPEDAPMAKVDAARNYGAEIVLVGEGYDEAHHAALERVQAGATLVHAFEDPAVIAGQGTLGLELAEQLPADVEVLVLPVGGGGLASGISLALKERRPDLRIVGVQAAGCAPYAGREPTGMTIADGIAVKKPGELTRSILSDRVDYWVTVEDDEIARAMVLLLERVKLVVEGAGAVSVAALLERKIEGKGAACALLAEVHVNVHAVEHHREGMDLPVTGTEVALTVATRDEEHCELLLKLLADSGYEAERLR